MSRLLLSSTENALSAVQQGSQMQISWGTQKYIAVTSFQVTNRGTSVHSTSLNTAVRRTFQTKVERLSEDHPCT